MPTLLHNVDCIGGVFSPGEQGRQSHALRFPRSDINLSVIIYSPFSIFMRMYCPKCEKSIRPSRIKEVKDRLREEFNDDRLERGLCPVCGTPLIDMGERE